MGLTERSAKRSMQLCKAICAIANKGGGVILAGIEKKSAIVKGMKITENMKEKYR